VILHGREQALAKTAFALMNECEIAPTPDNFELFYNYACGSNSEVGRVIDSLISERRPFTHSILDDLRRRSLSSARTMEAIDNASVNVMATLSGVLEKIEAAGRDAGDYGRTLSRASGELGAGHSPEQLKKFVDTLIVATHTMEERAVTLESELQRSSEEITTLKAQLDNVRKESLTDGLTAISNRKAFDQEIVSALEEAHRTGNPVSLLICDIDHFKKFNDTWGHQIGDQVLKLVACCLSDNVKGRDMVARFGGEEFVVVLRQTALDNATLLAERLRDYVQSKQLVKKSTGDILGMLTVSIGVASSAEFDTPASLIQRADVCLYRAKNTGRNRVVNEEEMADLQIDAA
jgi:diguanylate cyclase